MITIEAAKGREGVVRCVARGAGGSCQYDIVGFGRGRPGGMDARDSIIS